MTRSRVLAVVAAGLLVLVGGGVLVHERTASDAPSKAAATAAPSSGPTGKATSKGSTTNKGGSASSEIAPVDTQTQAPGAAPTSSSGLPGVKGLTREPLVSEPLPRAASAKGRLVAGYPRRVVPRVPGSTIRTSSVSPSTDRLQVALDAELKAAPADVLRFYAVRLARFGFVAASAPAVGGSQASSYTRGLNSLTVTVTPTPSGAVDYTVYGTLHTKS